MQIHAKNMLAFEISLRDKGFIFFHTYTVLQIMYSGLRQALTEILSSSLIGGHRTPFKSKGTQVCVAQLHLMQKREKRTVYLTSFLGFV